MSEKPEIASLPQLIETTNKVMAEQIPLQVLILISHFSTTKWKADRNLTRIDIFGREKDFLLDWYLDWSMWLSISEQKGNFCFVKMLPLSVVIYKEILTDQTWAVHISCAIVPYKQKAGPDYRTDDFSLGMLLKAQRIIKLGNLAQLKDKSVLIWRLLWTFNNVLSSEQAKTPTTIYNASRKPG